MLQFKPKFNKHQNISRHHQVIYKIVIPVCIFEDTPVIRCVACGEIILERDRAFSMDHHKGTVIVGVPLMGDCEGKLCSCHLSIRVGHIIDNKRGIFVIIVASIFPGV